MVTTCGEDIQQGSVPNTKRKFGSRNLVMQPLIRWTLTYSNGIRLQKQIAFLGELYLCKLLKKLPSIMTPHLLSLQTNSFPLLPLIKLV